MFIGGGRALFKKIYEKGSRTPSLELKKYTADEYAEKFISVDKDKFIKEHEFEYFCDEKNFFILPFELALGTIYITGSGRRGEEYEVNVTDYSTFNRVFTGLEGVIARWENSYTLIKNNDGTRIAKGAFPGNAMVGIIPQKTMTTQFEQSTLNEDFIQQYSQDSFNVIVDQEVKQEDMFKFFIIPQLEGQKWLYILNATNYYMPNGKFHHSKIEFSTVDNKIARSGRAVEQFIHRSAPGEGYTWPLITNFNNHNLLSLNRTTLKDIPIQSVQIEVQGGIAMGNFFCYGRIAKDDWVAGITKSKFSEWLDAPQLLIPYELQTPNPSPIFTRPSSESNWLCGKLKPTLSQDFKDWKEEYDASYDLSQRAKYEGFLKGNELNLNKSNPKIENKQRDILWDKNWSLKISVEKDFSYDNSANPLSKSLTFKKDTLYKFIRILQHNIFSLKHIVSLPLQVEQNIPWTSKFLRPISAFASLIGFGFPTGWNDQAVKVWMEDLILAIPAAFADYCNKLIKEESGLLRLDLTAFTDEQTSDEAIDISGVKSTGSVFKAKLTNLFKKEINGTVYVFDTLDLGQDMPTQDVYGNAVPSGDKKLQWDITCYGVPPTVNGFIVDNFSTQMIAKSNMRLSFYNDFYQVEVWNGVYQTQSKFTNNIRDWTTSIKLSEWKIKETLNYPALIVDPPAPKQTILNANMSWSFVYQTYFPFTWLNKNDITKEIIRPRELPEQKRFVLNFNSRTESQVQAKRAETNIYLFDKTFASEAELIAAYPKFQLWGYIDDEKGFGVETIKFDLENLTRPTLSGTVFKRDTFWKSHYFQWNLYEIKNGRRGEYVYEYKSRISRYSVEFSLNLRKKPDGTIFGISIIIRLKLHGSYFSIGSLKTLWRKSGDVQSATPVAPKPPQIKLVITSFKLFYFAQL